MAGGLFPRAATRHHDAQRIGKDWLDWRGRVSGHGNRGVAAPRANGQLGDRAVVVGAGMAGLVAAQVLADHFTRVTVIVRDRLPDGPAPRAGVPQSRHIHLLLARGMALLDQLFPGLEDELLAAGAVPIDFPGDALWLSPPGGHSGSAPACDWCPAAGRCWSGPSGAGSRQPTRSASLRARRPPA